MFYSSLKKKREFNADIIGYILARIDFKLNRPLYAIFLMGLLIPVHSLLVPIYVVFIAFSKKIIEGMVTGAVKG